MVVGKHGTVYKHSKLLFEVFVPTRAHPLLFLDK